ncbi:hypothetical protein ACFYP4_08715 [Streptomyces sp. NPDC005551]|uniref:hypothetical protein n=1 Tax=unclassified Streptomyces TaxID=2593676 RepID=UPI0033DC3FFF
MDIICGRATAAALTAIVVMGVSGCGGDADADAEHKPGVAVAPAFRAASSTFQGQVEAGSCESMEPDSCWGEMQALMKSARTLRKAMNGEETVSADFWTEAYTLIDTMEGGVAEGQDLGGAGEGESVDAAAARSNRDEVFGSGHQLSDWLDEHPIK